MSEVKKIATRDSYGNALVELAQGGADNLVVLDADLAGATKTGIFKKDAALALAQDGVSWRKIYVWEAGSYREMAL